MNDYPGARPVATNSTMAIISLIAGILSWVGFFFVGGIVAIICGHMAKNEIRRSGGTIMGDGMATAGLILGYANVAISVLGFCLLILLPLLGFGGLALCVPFANSINIIL